MGSPTPLGDRPAAPAAKPPADAAACLRQGLLAPVAAIPPKYFYDQLGSRLFAAITALDEYYPTRVEADLLRRQLPAIVAATALPRPTFVDLGAGDCEKAASLLGTVQPDSYVAVDISAEFLRAALDRLRHRFPTLPMCGIGLDFAERLELPENVPQQRRLFFYPGSSIGNFTPEEAVRLLQSMRAQLHGDGALWLGVDLQKDPAVLERAYDDPLGVTAAFNRNVLRHVNRIAGTDFDPAAWRHVARWDAGHGRIEMHLEAGRDLLVRWPGGERRFRAGERIHTENSYKHTVAGVRGLLAAAGLATVGHWTDPAGWFAFFVARPAEP